MERPSSLPDSDRSEPEQKKLKLAHELYGHLTSALNDWSDEIPMETLRTGNYKVRVNWFNAVTAFLRHASKTLIDDPMLKSKIREFDDKCTSRAFWGGANEPTKKEDIETTNHLIRTTLDYLQQRFPGIEDESPEK